MQREDYRVHLCSPTTDQWAGTAIQSYPEDNAVFLCQQDWNAYDSTLTYTFKSRVHYFKTFVHLMWYPNQRILNVKLEPTVSPENAYRWQRLLDFSLHYSTHWIALVLAYSAIKNASKGILTSTFSSVVKKLRLATMSVLMYLKLSRRHQS